MGSLVSFPPVPPPPAVLRAAFLFVLILSVTDYHVLLLSTHANAIPPYVGGAAGPTFDRIAIPDHLRRLKNIPMPVSCSRARNLTGLRFDPGVGSLKKIPGDFNMQTNRNLRELQTTGSLSVGCQF